MTLITSVSGIRGTLGGRPGSNLTAEDAARFTAAFAWWLQQQQVPRLVVIGRDARPSGTWLAQVVCATLQSMGLDVIDLGLSTTPTVQLMTAVHQAGGGIVITASHNPAQWNALKLLNHHGELLTEQQGQHMLELLQQGQLQYAPAEQQGQVRGDDSGFDIHIEKILNLPLVQRNAIRKKRFRIVVDAVNSSGGVVIPRLLRALGVDQVIELNCEPTGRFAHPPEPLEENLTALAQEVRLQKASIGLAVDPDVDRLAFVSEDGSMFGEEYTLVAVADYVLQHQPGPTVSNLSSTRALRDITHKHGCVHHYAPVGEAHVVARMKEVGAVIGGEGNGGIIYPALHYGRDALVGIALFLSHLATSGKTPSVLRSTYPNYVISKNKIQLTPDSDLNRLLEGIRRKYSAQPTNTEDGLRIEFDGDWVHLRRSNTEPIIRIYAESRSATTAANLAAKMIEDLRQLMKE
ncbi:MAG: phosphoglucosamine mutase [Chitinophagales bacterium]|nr:phosphoglucosamine mutase [Chitinophagales bacterium]MDW8427799.1 phosphoglucosamine mutase [Chitinophagales bacterium]